MGESEQIVAKALKGRRDDVVLATKFGLPMSSDPNRMGGSRRWIEQAVEDSLRRLEVDHIDLYQLHRYDPTTDLEETLAALTDLVRAGKIRAFGCSTLRPRAHRRGPLDLRAARPPALPHRAAPLLDPLPRDRGRRAAGGAALRHGRAHLRTAERRLAVGSGRRRRAATGRPRRRSRSTSRSPATRRSSRPPRR